MQEGIVYDCRNANCRTQLYTGKCRKACIEKFRKETRAEMRNKPITHADRIRSMTDEELADLLDSFSSCSRCGKYGNDCFPVRNTLEWLQQPAEEDT